MKIFVSQPMSGLSENEIMETRKRVVDLLKKKFPGRNIDVIDQYHQDIPKDAHPLKYLGSDIAMMADADIIVFAEGYIKSRGCYIERQVANTYGLDCLFESELKSRK